MRKRIIADPVPPGVAPDESGWLDLGRLTTVEVTSEDPAHPVETALLPDGDGGTGWRAAEPGAQTLRLVFDVPTPVRRVRLVFREDRVGRTQEFVLRWSGDGHSYHEVVRQQYTFSPPGTAEEVEDYRVNLDGVTALELRIVPDISGGGAVASVAQMQVAGARGRISGDEG